MIKRFVVSEDPFAFLETLGGAVFSPIIDPAFASPPEVRKIVGMDDFQILLSWLIVALRMERVEYEQFPGLIYRGDAGTALVFSPGK